MTKIAKQSLKLRSKRLMNKLPVKRIKLTMCEDWKSSSDKDPILPTSSSDECSDLSPIEEEMCSSSVSSLSDSSNSRYMSSFLISSVTTISSISEDESSYKPLHEEVTVANNDVCPSVDNIQQSLVENHYQSSVNEIQGDGSVVVNVDAINDEQETNHNVESNKQDENFDNDDNNIQPSTSMNRNHSNVLELPSVSEVNDIHRSKNFIFILMNFALVASNGNQLKYLMDSQDQRPLYICSLSMIIISCVFQFIAKICALVSYRYNLNSHHGVKRLRCLNSFIIVFTLLTTLVNIGLSTVILVEINDILPL